MHAAARLARTSFFGKTCIAMAFSAASLAASAEDGEPTNLYWGDTHLHTSYSIDAFLNGNLTATPDTAYRWAKGLPVIHPYNRTRIKIDTPLDFLVVADHAQFIGVMRDVYSDRIEFSDMGPIDSIKRWIAVRRIKEAIDTQSGNTVFANLLPKEGAIHRGDPVADPNHPENPPNLFGDVTETMTSAWADITNAADAHYKPGEFSTFVGWEWSSLPTGANLHRVVMSSSTGEQAQQYLPYGADKSAYPEDLWNWLEETERTAGVEFIAIPHNSNISKGYMFAETTLKGKPITADYAQMRVKWEPVAEITQIKGDSETHPNISPDDEFADFETYEFHIQQGEAQYDYPASNADYIRGALKNGLKIEQNVGVNPYKFGVIGSTDAHTGLASAEEDNFWGKMATDSIPENKERPRAADGETARNNWPGGWNMSASGLAAVWATENTREAIFAAFKRKEVYATTGPRIRVRFFGGWDFDDTHVENVGLASAGYTQGVPMGSDLLSPKGGSAPEFLIQAVRDPKGANLDRVQVVKGWVDAEGAAHERIYNVSWSGNRALLADGRLPSVGDTVDRETGEVDNSIGAPAFNTKWQDPDFDPAQRAFYYVRVLQIPTARHALLDAIALGMDAPSQGPVTIQERAYTSPIWYTPGQ